MTHFLRRLADKLPAKYLRIGLNLWPPFVGASIKIVDISPDFRFIKSSLRLRFCNKNFVGTHFGGSLFAMTDAFPMMMLIYNLGHHYIVWDKAAKIEFKKPGRGTLTASFRLTEEDIQHIKQVADTQDKYIFDRTVDVINAEGEIVATIVKTLYVRKKRNS